jgi:cobalt/nickel transport system permease protein
VTPGADARARQLAPQCKIAALLVFVFAVVSTPREAWWAFALHAGLVLGVAVAASVPIGGLLRRLHIEAPFIAFALFLPLVGGGHRVDVLGVSLSVDGMWGAWNIVAKGTLGVAAATVVIVTTSVPEMLVGLERLRMPRPMVAITGAMLRSSEIVTGELQRMRIARVSRGHDPRWIWQARAVAAGAGALFVRSYERGERVHVAMQSRGFDGALPPVDAHAGTPMQWATSLVVPALAIVVAISAWTAA